jgi:phosphatidylglycerol---prolipoprotein diacylglyceryl transferase
MPNILLHIGNVTIYTYSALMVLAVLAGLALMWLQSRRRGLSSDVVSDAALLALLGGLVGARLEYVALNLEYYREQPAAALRIWQGGLALHGGLWAGLCVLVLYAHFGHTDFWAWGDTLALGVSASAVFVWLACLYGGSAYGQTGFGPLHFVWYDTFGVSASRFAVQPLGAALSLALFVGLFVLARRKRRPGSILLLYLGISALIQFGLGFGRADETLFWWGWRADQWLNCVQVGGAVIAAALWAARPAERPPMAVDE